MRVVNLAGAPHNEESDYFTRFLAMLRREINSARSTD
jgi:hypothetical protein